MVLGASEKKNSSLDGHAVLANFVAISNRRLVPVEKTITEAGVKLTSEEEVRVFDAGTNPLTTTGVSYCECWAVTEHNCDPDYTVLGNNNPGAGQMASTTDYAVSDNFAEYQVIQVALKRIAGHTDVNNIDPTTPVTIDRQSEADEVSALLNNLPSKLNNCAIFSQASIDSN